VLAQDLKDCHGNRVGKIQAAQSGAHRNAYRLVRMLQKQLLGQSRTLLAEHDIDLVGVLHIGIAVLCLGGEIIDLCIGMLAVEIRQTVVIGNIQLVPVVQSRALQLLVVHGKAHWADQMQRGTGGGAGAGNVAGVLWDLRLMQYDMDMRHSKLLFTLSLIIIADFFALRKRL